MLMPQPLPWPLPRPRQVQCNFRLEAAIAICMGNLRAVQLKHAHAACRRIVIVARSVRRLGQRVVCAISKSDKLTLAGAALLYSALLARSFACLFLYPSVRPSVCLAVAAANYR